MSGKISGSVLAVPGDSVRVDVHDRLFGCFRQFGQPLRYRVSQTAPCWYHRGVFCSDALFLLRVFVGFSGLALLLDGDVVTCVKMRLVCGAPLQAARGGGAGEGEGALRRGRSCAEREGRNSKISKNVKLDVDK